MYRIELLPAAHGDAIWIEYGDPEDPVRVVIDGGPAPSYEWGLRARVAHMRDEARRTKGVPRIDLFVVTHIDCDHIDGPIIFLRENKSASVPIEEFWFNGWRHLPGSAVEAFQPLQGEFLSALIEPDSAFDQKWNKSFNRAAVVVPEEGPIPRVTLPQGGELILLSPHVAQLTRLRRKWSAALRDFNPGDRAAALQRLNERREYRPPLSADTFSAGVYGADPSAPNGSSIAFILRHEGKACLFAGDAHARVLASSLRRLAKEEGVDRVRLDAFKLAHHGSMGNISDELLSLVACENWLVSTNGAIFGHPDPDTVRMIGRTFVPPTRIFCNYLVETTQRLQGGSKQWTVAYPDEGADRAPTGGLLVDLSLPPFCALPAAADPPAKLTVPAVKKKSGERRPPRASSVTNRRRKT